MEVLETRDPRHTETVVEAQNELGAQLDTASHAADQTHEIGAITRGDMKSMSSTAPSAVSQVVTRISEPSR
jgi:hypothetical protein